MAIGPRSGMFADVEAMVGDDSLLAGGSLIVILLIALGVFLLLKRD